MSDRKATVTLTVRDQFSDAMEAYVRSLNAADKASAAAAKGLGAHAKHAHNLQMAYMDLSMGAQTAGMALVGTGGALAAVGAGSVKLAMDLEQTKVAFTTLTGSAKAAQGHLAELRDFAKQTPFQFTDLTEASKRMQAYGFAAGAVVPMLRDIGDASAALGGKAGTIDAIVRALGQVQAKGRMMAQEMLQLTEAGVPAWKYLAEAIGVSTAEVMKLSEKGLIPADQAIQAILAGMRADFGGMMAEQAKTAAGQISNLVDEITIAGADLGEVFLPAVKDGVSALRDLATGFNELSPAEKLVIGDMGAVAAAALLATGSLTLLIPQVVSLGKAYQAIIALNAAGKLPWLAGAGAAAGPLAVAGVGLLGIIELSRQGAIYQAEMAASFAAASAEIQASAATYEEYVEAAYQAAEANDQLVYTFNAAGEISDWYIRGTELMTRAEFERAQVIARAAKEVELYGERVNEAARYTYTATQAFGAFSYSTNDVATALEAAAAANERYELAQARAAMRNAEVTIEWERMTRISVDWQEELAGLVGKLDEASRGAGEYAGKIGEARQAIEDMLRAEFVQNLVDQAANWAKLAEEGVPGAAEAYANVLDAIGRLDPELRQQMEYSEKLATLWDTLNQHLATGALTGDQARAVIAQFAEDLANGAPVWRAFGDALKLIADQLGNLPPSGTTWQYKVEWTTNGPPPMLPPGGQNIPDAGGSTGWVGSSPADPYANPFEDYAGTAGPGFAAGGHFTVPAGYGGDRYGLRAESGEEVIVRTARQQRESGGGVTVNITVHPAPGMDEARLAERVGRVFANKLRAAQAARADVMG